ncbi:CHAT domain-containing protein [Streptomyces spongiae]|uniref:CHAT domain-containing protein n=1 Tax=Streptomyces spongiae TaxID=565072 RepID=A0A5N8XP00_9ACTN|nr:CHAT domain-containing protein [Streptomyces spongiae]MPY60778.1 CHAT domain-containing protein [Streptomyces spongiae]
MPQDLVVEVLQDPSHGYTGVPPQRGSTRRTADDEAPAELRVMLFRASENALQIVASVPDPAAPEDRQWHRATLDVPANELWARAGRLRRLWRDLVVRHRSTTAEYGQRVGGHPLAEAADLSELAPLTEALTTKLAHEGWDLLDVMLDGNSHDLGRFREFLLGALAGKDPLRITFDSDLHLPWPMLAMDPSACDSPWEAFLGHRHQVEQNSAYPWDQAPLGQREHPTTSLNTDTTLDDVGRAREVRTLLEQRSRLIVRTHGSDLLKALANPVLHEDVMYFWCHGHFVDNGTSNPFLAIRLSDGEHIDGPAVTRKRRRIPRTRQTRFKPFVLLNACHTAQAAAPGDLKHLGQELINMGADGILAPQIEIPQVFATEYAYAFLQLYLTGLHTAGEISQLLVRRFASEFSNPLALTYSLHCGINSRLDLAS